MLLRLPKNIAASASDPKKYTYFWGSDADAETYFENPSNVA